jgi:DNA-binding response OmpR family regulator
MSILVVEDERDLSDLLSYILRRSGHEVLAAYDGDSALRLWREHQPALVLLDVGIPARNGWEVCRAIRSESNSTPIMILSGADTEEDIIHGLELGAEDYVTKPFSPRLLQARIRTLLRRSQHEAAKASGVSIKVADLEVDADSRTARCGETDVQLTRLESRVLHELSIHAGQVVPHEELIQHVWGYRGEVSSSILKGHIRNIRLKLCRIGSHASVRIIPGVGYILSSGLPDSF